MAEYIEKEKLLEQIGTDSVGREGQYGDEWMFVDTITEMPTIDIVTCKYCKHRGKHKLYQEVWIDNWCEMQGKIINNPTWFCADGRRSDE